jgi:uridine phosphorylase
VGLYLRPTAPIAADALLPGDPKRAMELATALMQKPLMSNLSRGLWGYSGTTRPGRRLTVQSTGIGGPSAAAVLAELADEGVRRAIRIGTCVALDPELEPGAVIVVAESVASDGVGSALEPEAAALAADPTLTGALVDALGLAGGSRVLSADFQHERWLPAGAGRADGAVAVDLSTAAVLAVGPRVGVAVGCALVVAESAVGGRLADETLDRAALGAGERAASVFGAGQPSPEGVSLP